MLSTSPDTPPYGASLTGSSQGMSLTGTLLAGYTAATYDDGSNTIPLLNQAPVASYGTTVNAEQFQICHPAYTLAANTTAQPLFNATTDGALTIPVGTFFFETEFDITGLSPSSHNLDFGLGGTAYISSVKYVTDCHHGSDDHADRVDVDCGHTRLLLPR